MNGPGRFVTFCAIMLCAAGAAHAQATLQPTPAPLVTAESEQWYQSGEPLMYSGNVYYPAGPQVHFNGNEMVRSGYYKGVPVYSKTTIEPFSILFVPLAGGVLQPYERRRAGELAGTTGSSAPSFPVASPAEIATGMMTTTPVLQAAMPPTLGSPILFDQAPERASAAPVAPIPSQPVGTSGRLTAVRSPMGPSARVVPARAPRPVARRPEAANGVFIEFNDARWFSSGPATLFDARNFTRVGELRGLPVYTARGREATIFVPVAEGLDLVAPYSKRGK
jgi:hypothetical protein